MGTASLSKQQTVAGEVVRSSRKRHIGKYFTIILGQVLTFFDDHVTPEATAELSAVFQPNGQLIGNSWTGLTNFGDRARAKRACQTCTSDLRLVFG